MKVSLNWLRELVDLPPNIPALVDLLTLAGVEVEGIASSGISNPHLVVAEIKESLPHPNADRLSVCQVDDGSPTPRQIVCGAKNYVVGDKVPLALPGAVLGPDFKIKVGKLRGVESQGMLCSADELGMPKGADGLLILPSTALPGTLLSELFPGDTVLDLEITPNRPDLLSHIGIAREIAALTTKTLRLPQHHQFDEGFATEIIDVLGESCRFYTALEINQVSVGPSPDWLRRKLESLGLRSINNVVDITNFVMLETGQPLHAFDADKLHGPIRVRPALPNEVFIALDGKSATLQPHHLVIADDTQPLALAGIMGGLSSSVTATTRNLILESAHFSPQNIRRSSRELGISTDSSYRFERGVDLLGVLPASHRAASLITQIAGGSRGDFALGLDGDSPLHFDPLQSLQDNSQTVFTHTVPLRAERVTAILGTHIPTPRIDSILSGFGLAKTPTGWEIPSFRSDLTREIDLIEEIARVVGINSIPPRLQAQFAPVSPSDLAYDRSSTLRKSLVAQSFSEARTLTLISENLHGLHLSHHAPAQFLRVKNPMNEDQSILRPTLLPGLLQALGKNARIGAKSIRLFEIGRVFASPDSLSANQESTHLAFTFSGPLSDRSWRNSTGPEADLFHLKGVISNVLGQETTFTPHSNPLLALSILIQISGKIVGSAGQLWPKDASALDASSPVLFAEINLSALLLTNSSHRYREIPRFPTTSRDIALIAPLLLPHADLQAVLQSAHEPLLSSVELFDVFTDPTGEKIPADKKSLAYSLTYQSADRTLTADEVNAAHSRLKDRLKSNLPISFRE